MEMLMSLHPAIRARVHASQPLSAKRVRKVWRNEYRTNGLSIGWPVLFASSFNVRNVRACCFFKVEWSICPLLVGAGQTKPSKSFPAATQRLSSSSLTLGVIWQHAASGRGLSVRYEQRSVATIGKCNVLPAQSVTLIRTHSCIGQEHPHTRQCVRDSGRGIWLLLRAL